MTESKMRNISKIKYTVYNIFAFFEIFIEVWTFWFLIYFLW